MTDDDSRLLQRVAQQLSDMREESKDNRIEDREERRKWRDDIQQDIQSVSERISMVEDSIEPVVIDHKTVMRVIKWTGAGGVVTILAALWNWAKDNFK